MDLFDGRYEKIAPIGRGAFAEVWQATDTQTGVTLALKIFTIDKDDTVIDSPQIVNPRVCADD